MPLPDPDIWQRDLPVQPAVISWRDQFVPIEALLHMHYGFLESPRVHPIIPSISILETMKALCMLGHLKLSTTTNLTLNALHFISLMALHLVQGIFVPLSNTRIPPTMIPNNQFTKMASGIDQHNHCTWVHSTHAHMCGRTLLFFSPIQEGLHDLLQSWSDPSPYLLLLPSYH